MINFCWGEVKSGDNRQLSNIYLSLFVCLFVCLFTYTNIHISFPYYIQAGYTIRIKYILWLFNFRWKKCHSWKKKRILIYFILVSENNYRDWWKNTKNIFTFLFDLYLYPSINIFTCPIPWLVFGHVFSLVPKRVFDLSWNTG